MKQVIVVNKDLNMSPGKLAAMVGHGVAAYFSNWLIDNIDRDRMRIRVINGEEVYKIKNGADFNKNVFDEWIAGSFTKIVLEATQVEMNEIIKSARCKGFVREKDFFNIVDESTEFEDIPRWAVIAFCPMKEDRIDPITGNLNLYGYENSSLDDKKESDPTYAVTRNTDYDEEEKKKFMSIFE